MIVAGRRQEAAIARVADEALVALLQLPFERGQDGGPGGGVLLHLVTIATDDVAPPGQRHGLGLVFDVLRPLGQNQRNEGAGMVEHEFAHEFIGALAHAQDVEKSARLEFGDGFGADHAAIGDDANPANRKTLAQPIDDGDQTARIGGVSGRISVHRPAVAVEQHRQDHLVEIGPMVLGKAAPSKVGRRALEIEAGRIHEHQIERAEEIAPPREQVLLDDILQATRREGRGPVLLIFRQFLAEPGHRPIEVMQVEALDAVDAVILPPAVAARSPQNRRCRTVRNTARSSAKSYLRELARLSTTSRQPVSSHKRSKTSAGPMRAPNPLRHCRRRGRRRRSPSRRSARGTQRPLQLAALAQVLDAAEGGDHLLAHSGAFATAFDDLEIGAAARGFLTEIHGAGPREQLATGAHTIPWSANKVN